MGTSKDTALAIQNVSYLVEVGSSKSAIASALNISLSELNKRLAPDGDEALQAAFVEGLERLEHRLLMVVLNEAENPEAKSRDRVAAAKYLLDAKFGWASKETSAPAVQINLTMPSPMKMEDFMEIQVDDDA